ncbi:hypothetical protein DEJ17_11720 [Curtobacterium sp. MCSS17_011]|uniref:DUF6314 family protein n=1 Tax=Curtobacterium sp. MCSS17_011 TaxID=2175643 RepID=UPI000D83DFF1|nr:DUF6314 family protein [Curtobacterium sp. MCSS17_011]PYY56129.1 hypothetical protein DEJ17_11720 [Curtobacterium sp. MCSS17_011]
MLLPTDLLGVWDLHRTVHDHRAGVAGIVTGTTTLTRVGDDEVRWDETGVMTFDGRTTPVSRTLVLRRTSSGTGTAAATADRADHADGAWTVHFSDGRVFHDWVWGTSVAHACAPDDYTGAFDGDQDRWTVRWEARGPAKDYRLDSVLTRPRP